MLSRDDNELMCRVGAGTAMGTAMRRYWLPALLSSELPTPDCEPRRVQLLGESFVAFRDTDGRVGLLNEQCCHRGASLLLGRVENCGIRCIYHGWKFAVDGTVIETPSGRNPPCSHPSPMPSSSISQVPPGNWFGVIATPGVATSQP